MFNSISEKDNNSYMKTGQIENNDIESSQQAGQTLFVRARVTAMRIFVLSSKCNVTLRNFRIFSMFDEKFSTKNNQIIINLVIMNDIRDRALVLSGLSYERAFAIDELNLIRCSKKLSDLFLSSSDILGLIERITFGTTTIQSLGLAVAGSNSRSIGQISRST